MDAPGRLAKGLGHGPRHKAGRVSIMIRPDHRPPSQVRLFDHRIIWNIHVHAIAVAFGVPIDVEKCDTARVRAALATALALDSLKPVFQW